MAPEDKVVGSEAVHLADILAMASASAPKRSASAGAGGTKAGALRGRPLPSRPSRLGHGQRIDPVASIRAALPWQRLRPPSPRGQRIAFRASDLRMRRYETRTGRVVIFAVDASGSQAMARMAEAKGAVECLLAEAYRRRDEVALIAFRGQNAELLLPPTRALVRARSALAALPGGGGTPLAAGLKTAHALAASVQSKGGTPLIVLLSDGRANVALDGEGHRKHAKADAEAVAGVLKAAQFNSLVLDTGRRPDPHLFEFADKLGGQYVPLPSADAKAMSAAVSAVMDP
ncbi:MAG: VWA domain-containing protein [Pseudomonadota bacterium]